VDKKAADCDDECGLSVLLKEQEKHDHRPERQEVDLSDILDLHVCIVRLQEVVHRVVGVAFAQCVGTLERVIFFQEDFVL